MKTLSGLRISHKISALMVGLIVGFIVIGITYYVQISVDKSIRGQEQAAQDFQNELTALRLTQAEMQVAANQYLSTRQERFAQEYQTLSSTILERVAQLRERESAAAIGDALNQIEASIEQHQTLFNDGAAALGATADDGSASSNGDSGVRGQVTQAANRLQSVIEEMGLASTLPEFYRLRQEEGRVLRGDQGRDLNAFERQLNNFTQSLQELNVSAGALSPVRDALENYRATLATAVEQLARVNNLSTELEALEAQTETAFASALGATREATQALRQQGTEQKQILDAVVTAIIFMVAMGTAVGIYMIYKSIVFPMVHMQSVIRKINRGKTNTRVKVITQDELGDLGTAFNKLLDERIQQLEEQSKENDRLNNSIISLIRALGMIAKKDLTVKVPVSADITGTISDAVNLLTKETAQTLRQVRDVSTEVNNVSSQLDEQSSAVNQLAENERRQIMATSKALEVLARAMDQVAQRADVANGTAEQAIDHTQAARSTVLETVSGIRTIRETIAETEKRVKRLGDRSQEVSGIVNLINAIAERTHILALNASMHAASAGEAGKGFAVVADEVQRLAESARASTDEISAMVNSMRVDTSDTVNIMNTLISQVAEGSRLAEQAGQRMGDTEKATRELVENVKVIAEHATQQAEVANRVKDRAAIIRGFSEKTGKQLEEQRKQTEGLKKYAATLVERVNVFSLPEGEGEAAEDATWTNVEPLPSAAAKAS